MFDSHCHLTHPRFAADSDDVIRRAARSGVAGCLTIGTGIADARRALDLARRHPGRIACAAGLDPFSAHAARDGFDPMLAELARLLRDGGFHAVGEIGLDYHYDLGPPPVQIDRLERQLDLADRMDLPVVIHVREAHEDMRATLGAFPRCRGVIHSFTGTPSEAAIYLDLGWYLAFNGVVTYRNADAVREATRLVPENRLLVETDAPYLAPEPLRGRRCEPSHIVHTLDRLAQLRRVEVSELGAVTARNARSLFRLPLERGG